MRIDVFFLCMFWVLNWCVVFFFKQKTAYEMRISDWSSDVCSSDLLDLDALVVRVECRSIDLQHSIEKLRLEADLERVGFLRIEARRLLVRRLGRIRRDRSGDAGRPAARLEPLRE